MLKKGDKAFANKSFAHDFKQDQEITFIEKSNRYATLDAYVFQGECDGRMIQQDLEPHEFYVGKRLRGDEYISERYRR